MGKKRTSAKKEEGKPAPEVAADTALNPNHELFCRYITQPGPFFNNGVLSYAAAYDYKLETLSQVDEFTEEDETEDETAEYLEDQPHGGALKRRVNLKSPYQRAYNVCAVEAHRLLNIPKVQARCRELLNELMQDEVVDAERAKVFLQDVDLSSKLRAIVSYDKLKGRIIDKTQNVSRLPFGESDLSAVIATLPEERQDYFYGIIRDIIEEAELQRRTGSIEGSSTR